MADMKVGLTVKSADKARVVSAFKGLYPIPQEAAEAGAEPTNRYTDDEWVTERIKRFVRDTVTRHEQRSAMDAAKEDVSVPEDIVA